MVRCLLPGFALLAFAGCRGSRYTEAFTPQGAHTRIVVRADAGRVELVAGARLRVERTVQAPKGALDLEQRIEDGALVLDARCAPLLPCRVDTRVTVPTGEPVEVVLGEGHVWASGVRALQVAVDSGTVEVEDGALVHVAVGSGSAAAALLAAGSAWITVGHGDIDVSLPGGGWRVDVSAPAVAVEPGLADPAAEPTLQLLAPGGAVSVRRQLPLADAE